MATFMAYLVTARLCTGLNVDNDVMMNDTVMV